MSEQTIIIKNRINWFTVLLAVGAIILLVLLIRGCSQAKRNQNAYAAITGQIARLKKDSIEQNRALRDLQRDTAKTNSFVADLLATSTQLEDSLNRSEVYTASLARKIKLLQGTPDTIELLNNCEDVADAYLKEIDLNQKVRASKDSIQVVMKLQIAQRDSLTKHWRLRYESCMAAIDTVSHALPALKPRGVLLVGGNGIYSPFVIGGGPSVAYLTKGHKVYQGNLALTNHGNVYSASVMLPLNWKRH